MNKFFNKYNYKLWNIISLNVIIFTIIFYFLITMVWDSYSYDFKNIWFIYLEIIIFIFYSIIIFNEIAVLKNEQIKMHDFIELRKKDYSSLLKIIKQNSRQKNIYSHIFINKVTETAFREYKNNLSFIEKVNYWLDLETPEIFMKKFILELKEDRILKFVERERDNLALIFAYILEQIIWNKDENIQQIISENNYKINILEKKIENNRWHYYMKSLKKESIKIYENSIKILVYRWRFKNKELLDNNLKQKFVSYIFFQIAIFKYTTVKRNPIHSFFNFINPIWFITWKIFTK